MICFIYLQTTLKMTFGIYNAVQGR